MDSVGADEGRGRSAVAAFLSLLWPGLGQLYNGELRKAVLFAVGLPVLTLLGFGLAVAIPINFVNLLPLFLPIGAQLGAVVDAVKNARSADPGDPRRWFRRWYACLPLGLLNVFLLTPGWVGVMRTVWVQAFRIPTGSMETTILRGDHLLVSKFAYGLHNPLSDYYIARFREPQRGELVAYLFPEDRRRVFLHRVIALPGETVAIRDRQVSINTVPLDEPYARFLDPPEARRTFGPVSVPPGHVFVLGDNRDNSRDSRYWGFLPIDDVVGQAKVVYFSAAPGEATSTQLAVSRVRWNRLGRILR